MKLEWSTDKQCKTVAFSRFISEKLKSDFFSREIKLVSNQIVQNYCIFTYFLVENKIRIFLLKKLAKKFLP